MSIIPVSTTRFGKAEGCKACGAGSLLSFNWEYARSAPDPKDRRDLSAYVEGQPLRHGRLYACRDCAQPWYLAGERPMMNFVPRERLELIGRWNEREILLPPEQADALRGIGATPPDLYGNNAPYVEVPCAVTLQDGSRVEAALVTVQAHAPYEEWRTYRLASDIAKVEPSRFALSREVRQACADAGEIRMGLAPTVVDLPGGGVGVFNGLNHFCAEEGVAAPELRVSRRRFDYGKTTRFLGGPGGVVHFVADGPAL